MYEKPEVKIIEVSDEDIIQTSSISAAEGDLDITTQGGGGIEFLSLRPSSVESDALFKN